MKIFKRMVMIMSMAVLVGTLAGCTPKAVSLWVLNNDVKFAVNYLAYDVVYDGVQRNFSVKDENDFVVTLKAAKDYVEELEYADSEKSAFLFQKDGELFFVFKDKDKGQFGMRPALCAIFTDAGQEMTIACPPLAKFEYAVGDTISVTQDWSYFEKFYKRVANAKVNSSTQTVELETIHGNVTLVFKDKEIAIQMA